MAWVRRKAWLERLEARYKAISMPSEGLVLRAQESGSGRDGGDGENGGDLFSIEESGEGGNQIGVIRFQGEGLAYRGTQRGGWGYADLLPNATQWFQIALTLHTITTSPGTPEHCVSRLYIDGVLQNSRKDATGPGWASATELTPPIKLRLGSTRLAGVQIRDLFLYGRALSAEEVARISRRMPHASAWYPH